MKYIFGFGLIFYSFSLSGQLDLILKKDTSKNLPSSKPIVSIDTKDLLINIPAQAHKITSTSSHPLGLKLLHSWEILGRPNISDIKVSYSPKTNFVLIDANRAGKYRIKLRVRDENNSKDSIVFTINCMEQSLAVLLKPKEDDEIRQVSTPTAIIPTELSPNNTPDRLLRNFGPIARIKNVNLNFNALPFIIESEAVDPEGNPISYEWRKDFGGNINFTGTQTSRLTILSAENGKYGFSLRVRDDKDNEDNYMFSIQFMGLVSQPGEAKQVVGITGTDKASILEKQPPLKGGPENTLVSMVLPGVGHYLASGDYTGFNRKKYHFITTGVYIGVLGAAGYFKLKSEISYNNYINGEFEYQLNGLGVKTDGIRGGKESDLNPIYTKSKNQYRNSLYLFYAAIGITAVDATLTLAEGIKNKREYNNRWKKSTSSINLKASEGLVGVSYKLKF